MATIWGSATGDDASNVNVWADIVEVEVDWPNNRSHVLIAWYTQMKPGATAGTYDNQSRATFIVNGGYVKNNVVTPVDYRNGKLNTLATYDAWVQHDAAGNLTMSISGSFVVDSQYRSGGSISGSAGMTAIQSAPSAPTYAYIGPTAGATGLVVSEGNQVLNFSGATSGYNNAITGYHVYRAEYTSAGALVSDFAFMQSCGGAIEVAPPATRSNYYVYRVYTIGTYSNSGYKQSTNGLQKQPVTACGAPAYVDLSSTISDANVTLSWGGASAGYGNAIVGYDIEYAESSDGASWSAWQSLTSIAVNTATGSVSVAPPATRGYYRKFRVKTKGSAGAGYYSGTKDVDSPLRKTPYGKVVAPASCSLNKAIAESSATLNWGVGTDGYDNPVKGYDVVYSDDNGINWALYQYVDGKNTLSLAVAPRDTRGATRRFGVIAKSTATGIGSGDSARKESSNTLAKNRLPNTITGVVTVNKSIAVPGDIVRVTFAFTGDADNNLAGHEIAMKDLDDVWNGAPTIMATNADATKAYVDVNTAGWDHGKTWKLFVRGYDLEGARGEWSTNSVQLIVGAVCKTKYQGNVKNCLMKTMHNGVVKYCRAWGKDGNGVWKQTK